MAGTVEPSARLTPISPVTTASPKRTLTVRTFETVALFFGKVPTTGAGARAGTAATPVASTAPRAAVPSDRATGHCRPPHACADAGEDRRRRSAVNAPPRSRTPNA